MATLAIVVSDIHAHKYGKFNTDNQRLGNSIKLINHLFAYAVKNGINYILFCGDLYNTMQNISTEVETAIIKCFHKNFKSFPNVQWVAISGNHDYATKNLIDAPAVSALEHLAELFPNIWLRDQNDALDIEGKIKIHGIPHFEYPEHFRLALQATHAEEGFKNILMMHQQVGMDHAMVQDDISPDDPLFNNFDLILNGHIHQFKEVRENFIDVGSSMHRDAGDVGVDKGFLILDLEDLSWGFVDITDMFPQFIHKTVGEELTEWEEKQYVIWVPQTYAETVEEAAIVENFNTTVKPPELLKNFIDTVATEEDLINLNLKTKGELLNFGLKYFSSEGASDSIQSVSNGIIHFDSIAVEGFRSIVKPLQFNLHRPGLNLLKGVNGAGKTTLFEALVWCLYGINLKDTTNDKVVTWPEKRSSVFRGTSVTVDVAIGDIKYKISRNKGYKGDIEGLQGNDKLFIFKDGVLQGKDLHIKDMQLTIDELLGVDSRTFVNSILFGQRMAKLIESDNTDKRKLFEELFDTYWVDGMNKRMVEAHNECEADLNGLISKKNVLEERIVGLNSTITHYKEAAADWQEKHNSRLQIAKEDVGTEQLSVDTIKVEIQVLKERMNEFDKEGFEKADKEFSEAEQNGLRAGTAYDEAKLKIEENAELIQELNLNMQGYAKDVEEEVNRLKNAEDERKERIASRKKIYDDYKTDIATVKAQGPEAATDCETCGQPIKDQAAFDKVLSSMYINLDRLKEAYEDTKKQEVSKGALEVKESLVKREEIKLKEAEALTAGLIAARDETEKVYAEAEAAIKPLSEGISVWDKKKNAYDTDNNDVAVKTALLGQKEGVLTQANKRYTAVQEEAQPDYADKLKKANEDLTQNNKVAAENIEALAKMEDKLARLDWWNKKVLSSSGLRAYVFKAMLGQLNEFTKKYGQRLGVSLEFSIDLTKASKPFTTVCSLGEVRDKGYEEFSGGEKQRLDIVLVFAMHDLISQQADMNVLIMDEILEGLDEEGESSVFDLVRLKAEEGMSVYIITHSSVVDSLYTSTITAAHDADGNTIIT